MTLAGLACTAFNLVLIEQEPEAQLWARRDHDPLAVREIGRRYSDFARRVVRSFVHHRKIPGRYRMDELLSAGYVGLMSAVRRFKPELGWKFETFSARRIRGSVMDELRSTPPQVAGDGTENEQRVCPFGNRAANLLSDEDLERVKEAWAQLTDRARYILHLTLVIEVEVAEAARLMRMTPRTLLDLRSAAIRRLRAVLEIPEDAPNSPR